MTNSIEYRLSKDGIELKKVAVEQSLKNLPGNPWNNRKSFAISQLFIQNYIKRFFQYVDDVSDKVLDKISKNITER